MFCYWLSTHVTLFLMSCDDPPGGCRGNAARHSRAQVSCLSRGAAAGIGFIYISCC